jgi:hypothetical protein
LRWGAERRSRSAVADVEEEKPEPDLDELLEQFREPEEKPRRKAVPGSAWLMMALLLGLGGVWLAFLVVTGGPVEKTLGPPLLPTKVSDRTLREEPEVDVVEDYLARCKKGMTAQEVRWVIEDFRNAGLDQGLSSASAAGFIRLRKAQQAWYLDLLADGLRLDPEQEQTAKEKLAGLLEETVAGFRKDLSEQASEPIEQNGRRVQVVDAAVIRRLIESKQWLTDERYAPWELCELTDEQKRVTWFRYIHYVRTLEPGDVEYDAERQWFDPDGAGYTDPGSDSEGNVGDFATGMAPDKVSGAGSIFPFGPSQEFVIRGDQMAGPIDFQATRCHPDQLKTLLLVKPDTASRLLEALDAVDR